MSGGEGSGAYYDEARQFLIIEGVIARDVASFPLAPRPKRRSRAAAFDALGGNTTLGIHLSEVPPGGEKQGHRHLDEATFYIVDGRGWTELRQDDRAPVQRVDWEAGDVVVIPANAWHQHFNADPDRPARQLAFKNTRLLRKLFHSREFVYANDVRFADRYADEPDYWTRRETTADGRIRVNYLPAVADEAVGPEPEAGVGVGMARFAMGRHRMLEHALVEVAVGGHVREHRSLAEEAMLILKGSGRTILRADDGRTESVEWRAGDLVVPPFWVWRRHEQLGSEPVRYFLVRNNFIERALGVKGNRSLDGVFPDRFPRIVEVDRTSLEAAAEVAAQAG